MIPSIDLKFVQAGTILQRTAVCQVNESQTSAYFTDAPCEFVQYNVIGGVDEFIVKFPITADSTLDPSSLRNLGAEWNDGNWVVVEAQKIDEETPSEDAPETTEETPSNETTPESPESGNQDTNGTVQAETPSEVNIDTEAQMNPESQVEPQNA